MPATATTVDFISNHAAYRVIRRIAEEVLRPDGSNAVVKPELVYEFKDRRLSVRPGQDMLPDKWDDETGGFIEQDAVEFLRTHREFDLRFFENTPAAPDSGPVFQAITEALIAKDAEKLTAIGNEEYETWNRDEIMDQVRAGLESLGVSKQEE